MAKDELFIWLFQYLSKETRIKLLELMEKKTSVSFTPHSHEPQSIPSFTPSSPYSSSTIGLATSPVSSPMISSAPPLVRNDSAAAIEKVYILFFFRYSFNHLFIISYLWLFSIATGFALTLWALQVRNFIPNIILIFH